MKITIRHKNQYVGPKMRYVEQIKNCFYGKIPEHSTRISADDILAKEVYADKLKN